LGEEIARGGMGAVYRATDTTLGREVAVKVLLDRYTAGSGAARRFADEARITGQLQHPGIPPVHDLGTLPDGRPFLAMKLIKGDTLADRLAARPDPSADRGRFLAVFEGVCQAVGYAHAHGVVHRDLKPGNVMVGSFGEVQVMDWGLAKVLSGGRRPPVSPDDPEETGPATAIRSGREADEAYTQAGSVLGTPAFMPPEQAIGAVDQVDARSDVFGLGALLAAVLTGQPPFVRGTAESTRQLAARGQVGECFARLDACGADPDLVALCKRCLAAEKADRPRDAGEVAAAVAGLRAAADERARRAETDRAAAAAEAREQRKRRRVQFALAAAVGLLAAGGGAFAWWADRQARDRQQAGERQAADERDRHGRTAAAVATLLDQTDAALRAGDADGAGRLLAAAEKRAGEGGADDLAGRLARAAADLTLLRELDAADRFRWTPANDGKFPDAAALAGRYREALGRGGADPDASPPAEVAARVSGSAVRDRLVAALDRVLAGDRSARVREVLQAVDPDGFRDAYRDAVAARDRSRRLALLVAPAAAAQPPGFVAGLADALDPQHRGGVGGGMGAMPFKWDGNGNLVPAREPHPADDPLVLPRQRRALLTAALDLRPNDLGLLMARGAAEPRPKDFVLPAAGAAGPAARKPAPDDRARWYQAAAAVAPKNPAARLNLGYALRDKGDPAAAACFEAVVALDPDYAPAHYALADLAWQAGDRGAAVPRLWAGFRLDPGNWHADKLRQHLRAGNGLDGELLFCRERVRLRPTDPGFHTELGRALLEKARAEQADPGPGLAALREAARLAPAGGRLGDRLGLGNALLDAGDDDGALAEYAEAARLDPPGDNFRVPQAFLPVVVRYLNGDYGEVVARCREVVGRDPEDLDTRLLLALALERQADYAGAYAAYVAISDADPADPLTLGHPARVRRRQALAWRLPGVLAGTRPPAAPAEAVDLAGMCAEPRWRRYAAAARLYAGAFAAAPESAAGRYDTPRLFPRQGSEGVRAFEQSKRTDTNRYAAACAAARAGFGEGADAPADEAARAALRGQALGWLRADLPRWQAAAGSRDGEARHAGRVELLWWLTDPALAGTWSGPRRDGLPAAERAGWDALWADVRAVVAASYKAPPPPDVAPPPRPVTGPT
jgi:tetratricopeptide (TPR) repeat protein